MKNDYNIFGKIISVISNDYPPKMSKKFADRVMDKIHMNKNNNYQPTSNNYLNIAASIFFAVITTYTLVNYNHVEHNTSSVLLDEVENNDSKLIRKVIDKESCENVDNHKGSNNDEKCD